MKPVRLDSSGQGLLASPPSKSKQDYTTTSVRSRRHVQVGKLSNSQKESSKLFVRKCKKNTEQMKPPDPHFPRAHLWSWNLDNRSFGQELKEAMPLEIIDNSDNDALHTDDSHLHKRKKVILQSKASRIRNVKKGQTSHSRRTSKGQKTKIVKADSLEKEFEQEDESEFRDLRTPTPIPIAFGYCDENSYDPEYDYEDPFTELQKHRRKIERIPTATGTFSDKCLQAGLLPEPVFETKKTDLLWKSNTLINTRFSQKFNPNGLNLSHYGMGDKYIEIIAAGLESDAQTLEQYNNESQFSDINLSCCRITGKGILPLSLALNKHANIRSLNLSGNQIGLLGTQLLSEHILKSNICKMKSLNLENNSLGDRSIELLCEGLRNNENLIFLNLSSNRIGKLGVLSLASLLSLENENSTNIQKSSRIAILKLDWNNIGGKESKCFLKAVTKNRNLQILSVNWNNVGSTIDLEETIVNLIQENTNLKKLSLQHNQIKQACSKRILEALEASNQKTSLLSLDLTGNETVLHEFKLTDTAKITVNLSTLSPSVRSGAEKQLYTRYHFDMSSITHHTIPLDVNIWKKQESCWIDDRWVAKTIWYYPGISGAYMGASEITISLILPNGASIYAKMFPAPEVQYLGTEDSNLKQTKKMSSLVCTNSRIGLFKQRTMSRRLDEIGLLNEPDKKEAQAENCKNTKRCLVPDQPQYRLTKTKHSFSAQLHHKHSKKYTLLGEHYMCPFYTCIMLPPGRTVYKFTLNGTKEDTYALDQPTTKLNTVDLQNIKPYRGGNCKQKETQMIENNTVVNYVDVQWPSKPVGGIADCGLQNDLQISAPWTFHNTIFKNYNLITVDKVRNCFLADWEKLTADKNYLSQYLLVDVNETKELLWTNYPFIVGLFNKHASKGKHVFNLDLFELKALLENSGVLNDYFDQDVLFKIYDKVAFHVSSTATDKAGRTYQYVVNKFKSSEIRQSPEGLTRYQFLEFLVLVAVHIHCPSIIEKLTSAGAAEARVDPEQLNTDFLNNENKGTSTSRGKKDPRHELDPFEAVKSVLAQLQAGVNETELSREVFLREIFLFQDIIDIFEKHDKKLQRLFTMYSLKENTKNPFISLENWKALLGLLNASLLRTPTVVQLFSRCKDPYRNDEDDDAVPGLLFPEFLECLARLSHANVSAKKRTDRQVAIELEKIVQELTNTIS